MPTRVSKGIVSLLTFTPEMRTTYSNYAATGCDASAWPPVPTLAQHKRQPEGAQHRTHPGARSRVRPLSRSCALVELAARLSIVAQDAFVSSDHLEALFNVVTGHVPALLRFLRCVPPPSSRDVEGQRISAHLSICLPSRNCTD
ncbi:hypothetical protein GY45DRAFT_1010950 [Cubamyces sp. BRFM 1775]|nr:hypothetical protein GY45DRAFT_1010950 [Cubamyces sp. BRFM 1775]